MKSNRRARRGRDEEAQLLLLSGVILVLAFLATAVTLTQVADLEKQTVAEQDMKIIGEYRFLREKLGTTLADAVDETTNEDTFHTLFKAVASNLRVVANNKGYDLVVTLSDADAELDMQEWNYTALGYPHIFGGGSADAELHDLANLTNPYRFRSYDNAVNFEVESADSETWDGNNDGIVWADPCLDGSGTRCIQAAVVYLYMADSVIAIEEFVVFGFNTE